MRNKDKDLEFIRGMEKLKASPIRSPDYTSQLSNDTMKVKGGDLPSKEPVTRIKGATDKINTRGFTQPLGNAVDVMKANADKALRMKAMRKLGGVVPGLGAIAALGSGMMSDNASASDTMNNVMEELPGDLPIIGQAYDAIRSEPTGPQTGSFEDRLQKGQLSPEEMEMLRKQYLGDN